MTVGMLSYVGYVPGDAGTPWRHQHGPGISRRRFVQAAGAAGGLAVASRWLWPEVAGAESLKGSGLPRPIPETIPASLFDPGNIHLLHVLPPVEPDPNHPGQYVEPSTIFDFNGAVGSCHVVGQGTANGMPKKYNFDVDMGFTQGVFVGTDGRKHKGTFGFV